MLCDDTKYYFTHRIEMQCQLITEFIWQYSKPDYMCIIVQIDKDQSELVEALQNQLK